MTTSEATILPGNVRPDRYELTLTPDFDTFTFNGEETVSVELLEPTATVVLNSAEIAIQSSSLTLPDGAALTPRAVQFDEKNETVSLEFDRLVPAGPAELRIEFSGELNDRLRGFYRSQYKASDGQTRFLATTQFEATDARRAFPCWDEPALKANFKASLVVPSDLVAVSNMPVSSETDEGDGLKRVTFAETPPMSTYLLAFVVGDLRHVEEKAAGGTSIRVWTTAGNEERGRFALDVSVKLLGYFNDYFGIPYPLDKLDHLAIPDFAAGAMENWGAITYRETTLLVDPQQSSAGTRQWVAEVVAHEMAHMWFGDLVTMAWWNDLWLNESFASWMGDKAVDHLFPEWQMWTQFVEADTARALRLDGLQNSHPIEQPVNNPSEIGELFDAISYSKGGSILRMLERYVGPEDFRRGLGLYMDRHKYGNARTTDLWDALGEASSLPVRAMMDTWVNQTGYPVLSVQVGRGEDGVVVAARQRRFLYEHVIDPKATDRTLWHVPLSISSAAGSSPPPILMDGPESAVHLTGESDPAGGWVKLNPGQTGFYRVDYGREGWDGLIGPIQALALPAVDRLGVQNDAYALSRAGMLPITTFLTLAQAYVNETDASVWQDLTSNLSGLDSLLNDEPHHPSFQKFARDIVRPTGERVSWDAREGEGHLDSLLRSAVLSSLGHYGDEDTLGEAAARFEKYGGRPRQRTPRHPHRRLEAYGQARRPDHLRHYVGQIRWGDFGRGESPCLGRTGPFRRRAAASGDAHPALSPRRSGSTTPSASPGRSAPAPMAATLPGASSKTTGTSTTGATATAASPSCGWSPSPPASPHGSDSKTSSPSSKSIRRPPPSAPCGSPSRPSASTSHGSTRTARPSPSGSPARAEWSRSLGRASTWF